MKTRGQSLVVVSLLGLSGLFGCSDSEECITLKGLELQREKVLASARARADAHSRLVDDVKKQEAAAQQKLHELGLDEGERDLGHTLLERVRRIPTATVTKNAVAVRIPGETREAEQVTRWQVTYTERDPKKGIEIAWSLAEGAPLFRFSNLVYDKKDRRFTLDLLRASVDQIDTKPAPQPLPARDPLSKVKEQFGFCGASDQRARIMALDAEIDALEPKALESTTLLPMAATWQGLKRRTELLERTELEARRILRVVSETALLSKTEFKAMGVEDTHIVLEVLGSKRDRARVEDALPQDLGKLLIKPQLEPPGVLRFIVPNPVTDPSTRSAP